MIAHEHTSKEIASELYISTETVLSHRRNIMHKMNVRNVAGMVRVGMERGLVGMVVLLLLFLVCLLYTSPSPRDRQKSRMPSSA